MTCPRCGVESPEGARFCPSCGLDLSAAGPREERKFVSVLFVDMVGSTEQADGADPEDVRERNQLYYDEVRGRIEKHGGTVEKYIGDAVLAVFGAPLASADDAERAVAASRSVLEGIDALNLRHPGLDLAVRAAVGTGEAMVTIDATPEDTLATGDIVNTASRLQNAAPTGGVIVDAETRRLTRHAFAYEELPPVVAKGKREPVLAWLVGEPVTGARPVSHTPLVGRDQELSLIRSAWERAVRSSRPHLVTVLGPAGIGKSRLAREFADVVAPDGRALWGRSLPYEEPTPYLAAGEIVRRAAAIFDDEPADVARAKLASLTGSLLPVTEVDDATRYLSLLLGLGLDEPTDDPVYLQFAARQLVERLAEREPLLLVFEDLHWADDALLELIDYLVAHVRNHRVVFLALARPEFLEARPSWGTGMTGHTTLPLETLLPDEATEVVAALLKDAPADTVERVVTTAGGNPLFIEELAAAMADDPSAEELPSTVRAAIAARIDALPTEARDAILHASIIGNTFWRGVVQAIDAVPDIEDALDALEARGLVLRRPESTIAGDVEYAFKHSLIRETAYATLPRSTRRELHGAVARYIEESVGSSSELAWLLGHHWREAGESERAMRYFITAAERTRDALAVEETYDLYSRALELAASDEDRVRIRFERALSLAKLEDFARADRELTDVIPSLSGQDEIEALIARARSSLWTEQTEQTMALASRAVELVGARDARDLEGPALALLSAAYTMRGDEGDLEKAIELGDHALDVWVSGARDLELAEHYHLHADAHYWAGVYPRTLELSRLAAETGGKDSYSAEYRLRGVGMQGISLAGLGRYEESLVAGENAIALSRKLGRSDNVVMNYSTLPLREIFAVDEALARSELVVSRLGPSSFNMPWLNGRADLLGSLLLQGDLGRVERDWLGTWDDAVASDAWEHWLIMGRLAAYRADLELQAGRLDDAVTWARRAIEGARTGMRPKYEAIALTTLGKALTLSGVDAAAELRSAVEIADRLGSPLLRWQTRGALAGAVASEREALLQEAASLIHGVAASLAPERSAGYLVARQVVEVLEAAG
jgi:class 3 adenylate cyclase/tetratricopeptide (TPR) repeat protein